MTDSDPPRPSKSALCLNIRRINTLWSAWIAIRSKALQSSNQETRASANCIDENPNSALATLQRQLCSGTFRFEPQTGVLKKRKGKNPRPLVISPVPNRIVQRAILDTLQSKKTSVRRRLRSIPNVLYTPTSVGGIPKKGSSDAVRLIRGAIADGATHYVRSDIKDFFTSVKTAQLVITIENITGDGEFAEFLKDGLHVELANADQPWVREWIELFPDGHTGVPQGSSLSTFCANFVLRYFDYALNRNGLVTIRYIDDFIIFGHSEKEVSRGWTTAKSILRELDLQVHEPSASNEKASLGQVSEGFEFLSYRFRGKCVGLSRSAKLSILEKIDKDISTAKRLISGSLAEKRRAQARLAQALVSIDRRVRGWGDSFREVDQRVEFKQLDENISSKIRGCQRRLKIRPKGGAKDCHLGWWSDLGVRLGVGDAVRGFFGGSGQRSHAELKRSAPAGRPQGGMVYRIGVSLATRALGARCRPGPSDGVPQFSYRHCFCGRGFG